MKLEVYSVYDKAVGAYLPPFYVRSAGEAVRAFTDAVNNVEHQFYKYSADYTLFYVGQFDDSTGMFLQGNDTVRRLSAMEVLVRNDVASPPVKRGSSSVLGDDEVILHQGMSNKFNGST